MVVDLQGHGGGAGPRLVVYHSSEPTLMLPKAGEQSGYIGAAIVGAFVVIVGGYYGIRWLKRRRVAMA